MKAGLPGVETEFTFCLNIYVAIEPNWPVSLTAMPRGYL